MSLKPLEAKLILFFWINDCECVSNALAIFSCDVGATAMSYLKFSNWIYYSIFDSFANPYQFALLNIEACPFEDIYCDEKNFVWHPLFFFFSV